MDRRAHIQSARRTIAPLPAFRFYVVMPLPFIALPPDKVRLRAALTDCWPNLLHCARVLLIEPIRFSACVAEDLQPPFCVRQYADQVLVLAAAVGSLCLLARLSGA